jgi:predicted acyltransferase
VTAAAAGTARLASVDALRGLTVAAMLFVNNPGDWSHVLAPFRHAKWDGCTPTDIIFPFFLFIVGVSVALAFAPRLEGTAPKPDLRRAIAARALRLFVLGVGLNVLTWLAFGLPVPRVMGVLQRIALCYGAVATLAITTRPKTQWAILGTVLLGYWGLLLLGGSLTPDDNLAGRIDTLVFGRSAFEFDAATGQARDPEGLLSTLPAIGTTLLGLRAGFWLLRGQRRALVVAGVGTLVLGLLWSIVLPFNKNLWTPSFVLWTAGWAFLALALCHELVDRRGWRPLGRTFGVNAIAVFAGSLILVYVLIGLGLLQPLYETLIAGWLTPLASPFASSHAFALLHVVFWWVLAWRLDKRGLYFKI